MDRPKMPTYRQVWLDLEAEKVLAPTDWTMPFEEMLAIVSKETGYAPKTIQRAMFAVSEWDLATSDLAGLRKNYNLEI